MIKVKNLSFAYPGTSKDVLRGLDFEIAKGEIFGFLGPSGAGKSTAQKILYRLLKDFKGEVEINGKPLNSWGDKYFENIGVGFELPNHYLKLTAKENLQLFASFYPNGSAKKLDELFEMVGLEESINQKVEEYSKGMKMRLNFIRAIMHDPEILFFDEPTSGMDPVNGHKIKELILNLKKEGKTIFITTHDMTTADELCDRVSFLVKGAIEITDVPSKLKHQYGQNLVRVELKNGRSVDFPIEAIGQNDEFSSFLQQGDLLRINTLEATLEEVFIQVTGKALRA